MDTAQLKKVYKDTIAPELQKQFNYSSAMQIPVLKKRRISQTSSSVRRCLSVSW